MNTKTPPPPTNGFDHARARAHIDKACRLLAKLQEGSFWGDLTLSFQRGEIIMVTKTETLKPERDL